MAFTADTGAAPPPDPQAALKRYLPPGATGECALCGRTLSTS
ncbi:hypothetical protein ABZW03_29200 [Kitasatospora sp. NPDC004799]